MIIYQVLSSIYTLVSGFTLFTNIAVAYLVFTFARQNKHIYIYFWAYLILIYWQVMEFASVILFPSAQTEILLWYGWKTVLALLPWSGYLFYLLISKINNKQIPLAVGYSFIIHSSILSVISLITNQYVIHLEYGNHGYELVYGPLFGYLVFSITIPILAAVLQLIKESYKVNSQQERTKKRVLAYALMISLLCTVVAQINVLFIPFNLFQLANINILVFSIVFLNSILNQQLFSLRIRKISIRTKVLIGYLLIITELVVAALIASNTVYNRNIQVQQSINQITNDINQIGSVSQARNDPVILSQIISQIESIASIGQFDYFIFISIASTIISSCILIVFITSKNIISPIDELQKKISILDYTKLDQPIQVNAMDEIGELAQAFEKMRKRLKEAVSKLETDVDKKTKALKRKVKKEKRTTEAMIYLLERSKKTTHKLEKSEKKLKQANKQLQQIDKLKSEFLSNASHELRTPLTSIKMYNQLIHDQALGPITAQQKDALKEILQATNHLIQIVNDILDIKKMEAGKLQYHFEDNAIQTAIDEALVNLKAYIQEHKVTVKTKIDKAIPIFKFDKTRIVEIIQNLVTNAIKYNQDNNPITIKSTLKGKTKQTVQIDIIDHGIGMSKSAMSHLFDKFYQVDASITRQIEGTGLGLAISKNIAKAHGGDITVTSIEGQGSAFTVTIPIKK